MHYHSLNRIIERFRVADRELKDIEESLEMHEVKQELLSGMKNLRQHLQEVKINIVAICREYKSEQ